MCFAQSRCLVADNECWTEEDVDSQFPAYYFNFEKPTILGNLPPNHHGDDQKMIRNKHDPLLHLPCRILDDWYLRLKPQRSMPYFTIEKNVFPYRRVSLPVDTQDMDKFILGGILKPQLSGQDPIRIELDGLDFYTIDNSKGFRGYWVVTSQARYWLRNPCSRVLEIPKMRITVEGGDVLAWDNERDAFNKGGLRAKLPSQEQLHQFHEAQLGLFCGIVNLMICSNGTYNSSIHTLSLSQLNTILALKQQQAEMRAMNKPMQQNVRQNLAKESKLLLPHLRAVDPDVRHSRWFQELVATCDDNQDMNLGPNENTFPDSHRIESMKTTEVKVKMDNAHLMERQSEPLSASESCNSVPGLVDHIKQDRDLLPKRPLTPLEPNKGIMELLSRSPHAAYSRPSIPKHEVIAEVETSIGLACGPQNDSSPKKNEIVKSMSTGSVVPRTNPVTNGTVAAGTQQSSSSPQSASLAGRDKDHDRGIHIHSDPCRSSNVLMKKPQKVLSPCIHPPPKNDQARQPPHLINVPANRDATAHVVVPVKSTTNHSSISISTLPTIPKKPRTTGHQPQSNMSNQSMKNRLDQDRHNIGSNSTVPGNACTFAEERQPKEISRAESPLKLQDSSRSNPSSWKRQKTAPSEFRQNVTHAFEAPHSHANGRKTGVQPYQGVQHPGRVDRSQCPSGLPIRGPAQMRLNQSSVQPDGMAPSLPHDRYEHPVRPVPSSQPGRSQFPRRTHYPNKSNRFADRQYHPHYHHKATQSHHFKHPRTHHHGRFQAGWDPRTRGVGNNNNKTAQFVGGVGGKRSLDVLQGENRAVPYGPMRQS